MLWSGRSNVELGRLESHGWLSNYKSVRKLQQDMVGSDTGHLELLMAEAKQHTMLCLIGLVQSLRAQQKQLRSLPELQARLGEAIQKVKQEAHALVEDLGFQAVRGRRSCGLAFSGGGIRASAQALGPVHLLAHIDGQGFDDPYQ